jgi:hypothetical protein
MITGLIVTTMIGNNFDKILNVLILKGKYSAIPIVHTEIPNFFMETINYKLITEVGDVIVSPEFLL